MIWPAYMTTTRWAISAITPMLCVISTSAMPRSRCSVLQQVEDLRLDGDVEGGGRLIRDQQARGAGDRHRDHHALAHAAGELVREGGEAALGGGDADLLQQLDRPPARGAAVEALVHAQRLGELEADGEAGVEARLRVLEDHGHLLAGDGASVAVGDRAQIAAGEG